MRSFADIRLDGLLAQFPKARPPLPQAFQDIYTKLYVENRAGETATTSMSQRLEHWLHRQVAADTRRSAPVATLEIGAGTLNQLPFEPANQAYDVVEPFGVLYEASPRLPQVRTVFADIADVPAANRYARITNIASLEHICDLPVVLARAALLLDDGGTLRSAIPSEGGFLWKLGWSMTTGVEFRLRHGLDYAIMMAHEHVNDAREIETLIAALFDEVEIRSFGLGRQLSLYRFVAARGPRLSVARAWLERFAA